VLICIGALPAATFKTTGRKNREIQFPRLLTFPRGEIAIVFLYICRN
jgi:hypothetical protein